MGSPPKKPSTTGGRSRSLRRFTNPGVLVLTRKSTRHIPGGRLSRLTQRQANPRTGQASGGSSGVDALKAHPELGSLAGNQDHDPADSSEAAAS